MHKFSINCALKIDYNDISNYPKQVTLKLSRTTNVMVGWPLTSLLRRLQSQTLSDATPLKSQIHQLSKIIVTVEEMMQFLCPF